MFIATYHSRHYTFEGCGNTAEEALRVCKLGLADHGRRCNLPRTWWRDGWSADCTDLDMFDVQERLPGMAYSDGHPIAAACKQEH